MVELSRLLLMLFVLFRFKLLLFVKFIRFVSLFVCFVVNSLENAKIEVKH